MLTYCQHDTVSAILPPVAVQSRRLAPEARRRQLVDEALALFAAGGHDEVGLEHVAARAHVRRSLLYRYFPGGKPDLYLAVVEEAWRRLVEKVDTDAGRPLEHKLPDNVTVFLDLAERGDPAMAVLAQARRVDEPRVRAVTRDARRSWSRLIAENHLGHVDPPETVVVAITGYLALAEVLMEEWLAHSAVSRPEVEAILEGALPPIVDMAQNVNPHPIRS